jgi:5-methylcytosine-specific restriction protein B
MKMKTVAYKNYTVTRFKSGTIEATKDGHIVSPTKPLLRELAQELNVNIENVNGNLHITRQLGVLVMRAIEKYNTEKH